MNIQGISHIKNEKKKKQPAFMELEQVSEKEAAIPKRRVAFELILAVALSAGCWYTWFSMFPSPVDTVVCACLITALPLGLYLLCWNPFFGRFLVFYVFLLTAILFLLAYKHVWNGLLVMANIVVEVLNQQMGAGLIPFDAQGDTVDWTRDVFLSLIPLMLLTSMAIVHSIFYKEPLLGFVLTAIPTVIGLCMKASPSVWLLVLLILCWSALLVLSALQRPESRGKRRPLYIQGEENSSLPYLFLGAAVVLVLGYVLIFSGASYRPPQTIDGAKEAVVSLGEHIRYDKLGGDKIDELKQGDLTKTRAMAYTENPVLTLKMQTAQPMYLRGFTGGSFEKGRWKEAAEGAYSGEYTGITQWLAKNQFYPWLWQDQAYRLSEDYDFASVQVNNINGNSKYIYLPYEAVMTGDAAPDKVNYERDFSAFAKGFAGQREYTFKAFFPKMTDYSEAKAAGWLARMKANSRWQDYADAEAVYRRFVYDTYLYVSDEDSQALGTSGIDKCQGKTIAYTLRYIRENFLREFEYDLQQEKAPDGQEELSYFMNKSRRGGDMHFATAAALMFRKAGIPARYVEGYYLSPDYVSLYTGQSDISIDVPDSLAHSWVEVYIDEMGWFPVEVIPGFFELEKEETVGTQDTQQMEEETTKQYRDQAPSQDEPDQEQESQPPVSWKWLLPGIFLVLAALYELAGRYWIRKRMDTFGRVYTDEQVFAVYRHIGRLMAFDGHPLPPDPYDKLEEISQAYDPATEMKFAEFLVLVSKVRFGRKSLTREEHKKMARYALEAGSHIYHSQSKGKQFLMKFILFYL